jgi:hypothetical protein
MTEYRPPRACPVCSGRLDITQLGCHHCGTGLSGRFQPCEYCALDDAQRDVLRVFLSSRGNMKELERHLGVSYPTARARFDEVLRALGMAPGPDGPTTSEGTLGEAAAIDQTRLAVLRALADGQVDVTTAMAALDER